MGDRRGISFTSTADILRLFLAPRAQKNRLVLNQIYKKKKRIIFKPRYAVNRYVFLLPNSHFAFPILLFQTLTVLIIIITRSNMKTSLNGQRHATFSKYTVKQNLINYGRRYGIPLIIACDLAREASNIYVISSKFNSFTLYDRRKCRCYSCNLISRASKKLNK